MYGTFGAYGDAVSDLQGQIKAAQGKVKALTRKLWKLPLFSRERRLTEIAANKAVLDLRALRVRLSQAKRSVPAAAAESAATASGLSAAQQAEIEKLVADAMAQGVDADTAEDAAKARVLPPRLRRAFPRGYFRRVRRAGPRPVLPPTVSPTFRPMPGEFAPPTRDIDPRIMQRSIDPRFVARNLGPFPPGHSIDPVIPQVGLVPGLGPQAGSFTFPPGNLTTVDPDSLEDAELSGGFDLSASNPWVLGGLAVAALYVVPKLFKGKKGGAVKTNPRRRRKHRRNRR